MSDPIEVSRIAEREAIVRWLLEVGDDWPWTGLDIANMIASGCPPWPEALRRPADELAELVAKLSGVHLERQEGHSL